MSEEENSEATEAHESETVVDPSADHEDDEFRPFDEIAEGYQPKPLKKVAAADGLPTQVSMEVGEDHIPALSPETLVCLEDTSQFVLRDALGRPKQWFEPNQVEQMPNGKWFVRMKDVNAGVVEERLRKKGALCEVVPKRVRCSHYVEQQTQFEHNPAHMAQLRLCSGRRTVSGAFMSVTDLAMWACSMREPRDLISEERLLQFNKKKREQGETRVESSIFGKGQ